MNKVLIIYGPTVTGKTDLAIRLAREFNGELISADSRQVYKGLDIGTGKVSFDSKVEKHTGYWIVDGVKIHGFDIVSPSRYEPGSRQETFNVADFVHFTFTTMIQIIGMNKLPIVVGGTGFYLKALIGGIDSLGIKTDQKLRQQLEKLSVPKLFQKLLKLDLQRARSMNESDRANPRRLIRAIEIALANQKLNRHHFLTKSKNQKPIENYLLIILTAPNDYLYNRSDKWLETRLEKGMISEVQDLIKDGVDPRWFESLGLEYRWITRFILGKVTKDQMTKRLIGDIHNLIRRQKTWFSKFADMHLIDISRVSVEEIEKKVGLWYTESRDD